MPSRKTCVVTCLALMEAEYILCYNVSNVWHPILKRCYAKCGKNFVLHIALTSDIKYSNSAGLADIVNSKK